MPKRTAIALAGLGGSNAHGSGFLAAAQAFARDRGARDGLLPGLEMISCTSGAIASTALYLRGEDLGADLEQRINQARQSRDHWWLGTVETPQQAAVATLLVGVPGVFRGLVYSLPRHYWRTTIDLVRDGIGWRRLPTAEDLTDLLMPARVFVPELSDAFFERTADTLNAASIGVVCNSFAPTQDVEYLHVNEVGLELIREYHDPSAAYDGDRGRVRYRPITPTGLREALWLFSYGLQGNARIDGAYARSIILDELTFAEDLWAVRPLNNRWIGSLPSNLPEVLDLQTELWMNASYRQQIRALRLIERLDQAGRTELSKNDDKGRDYHEIELHEVELASQRGFYSYFIEDMAVFRDAREAAYHTLSAQYPQQS